MHGLPGVVLQADRTPHFVGGTEGEIGDGDLTATFRRGPRLSAAGETRAEAWATIRS